MLNKRGESVIRQVLYSLLKFQLRIARKSLPTFRAPNLPGEQGCPLLLALKDELPIHLRRDCWQLNGELFLELLPIESVSHGALLVDDVVVSQSLLEHAKEVLDGVEWRGVCRSEDVMNAEEFQQPHDMSVCAQISNYNQING